MTNFNAFAQNNCSAQDNAACAQSDLSLPVPSENEIVPPGVQQPPENSQDNEEDLGGQDDKSEDNSNDDDGNTFLLPFP